MKKSSVTASHPTSASGLNLQKCATRCIADLGSFATHRVVTFQPEMRSAIAIIMLCIPALMLFVGTTVPTMLFESPDQQAYFHFASILSHDLSGSFVFVLAALCMVIAMALSASKRGTAPAIH